MTYLPMGISSLHSKAVVRRAVTCCVAAALAVTFAATIEARAQDRPPCHAPLDVVRLAQPLTRVAHKLAARQPLVIVAIGSSSTAGAGASSPAANYPSRLQAELQQAFPGAAVNIVNSGVNGEVASDMIGRFDDAVIAHKPDLVLWQVGTNSVLRDHPLKDHGALIRIGIDKVRAAGADVVLIDPQFAPKVIAKPDAEHMVELIATTAKVEAVDLFPRFAVMKRWRDVDGLDFKTFVSADGLHMNDWSYACMAKGLGVAIAEAAQRPVLSAKATAVRR